MGYKWEDFEKKEEIIFVIEVGKKDSENYLRDFHYNHRIRSASLSSATKWSSLEEAKAQIESIRAMGKKNAA